MRKDAEIADRLKPDSGAKSSGSGGGSSGSPRSHAVINFSQPQRYEDCRICQVLETEGEEDLYDAHLSTWPTGCPKFIQMSSDERFDWVLKARLCKSCLDPDVEFNQQHFDDCKLRKNAMKKQKSRYTCKFGRCSAQRICGCASFTRRKMLRLWRGLVTN